MERNTCESSQEADFSATQQHMVIRSKLRQEKQKIRFFRKKHKEIIVNNSYFEKFTTVIPFLSAGMYLLGTMYHQGYLKAFGVDDSLFPLTIDEALFSGFFASVRFGLEPIFYVIIAIFVLLLATCLAIVIFSVGGVKKFMAKIMPKMARAKMALAKYFFPKRTIELSERMKNVIDKGGAIYIYIAGISLLALSLWFVAAVSEKSGREQGMKEMTKFQDSKGSWVTLYTGALPAPVRAKQIICGTSHCAFFLGKESIILRHENVDRVVTHPSSTVK